MLDEGGGLLHEFQANINMKFSSSIKIGFLKKKNWLNYHCYFTLQYVYRNSSVPLIFRGGKELVLISKIAMREKLDVLLLPNQIKPRVL